MSEKRRAEEWWKKEHEQQKGVPLSRLPAWRRDEAYMMTPCDLEEVLIAYDALEIELARLLASQVDTTTLEYKMSRRVGPKL